MIFYGIWNYTDGFDSIEPSRRRAIHHRPERRCFSRFLVNFLILFSGSRPDKQAPRASMFRTGKGMGDNYFIFEGYTKFDIGYIASQQYRQLQQG